VPEPSDEELVRATLRLARIAPPDAEVEAMAAMVEPLRTAVERLYAMDGILYAEPAVRFAPSTPEGL
jgi:hypothetical protein